MDFQSTLFEAPASGFGSFDAIERRPLSHGAWVDVLRSWMPDADDVFATLVREVPWRAERRQMYERLVDVPRLLHTYMIGEELPHPLLTEARDALSAHYADELGEPFRTAGLLLLPRRPRLGGLARRPDRAWRTPTTRWSRSSPSATRAGSRSGPAAAGTRSRVEMGHGDLVVMGGSCQRTWEHAVPKVAHAGPRVSVQFRPLNVF